MCTGIFARRARVDEALIGYLEAALADPRTLAWIEESAIARAAELSRRPSVSGQDPRARQAQLGREIERMVDAIATVGASPALSTRLRAAEAELGALKRATTRATVSALPAAVRQRARAMARDLAGALRQETGRAREALRAAFGEIRLVPEGERVYAEFEDAAERLMLAVGGDMGLVAGECNLTRIEVG